MTGIEGRKAVVVGAGQGIGRAVALRLAAEGADVAAVDIDARAAEEAAREVRGLGRRGLGLELNVTETAKLPGMAEWADRELGGLDILVYSAGVVRTQSFMEITEADWDLVLDVNLKGMFFCIQAVAARMIARVPEEVVQAGRSECSRGKIVTFSSISGRRGRAYQAHYAASKAAIISLTQSAALAFAPYNINVNAVSPSVVPTRMWEQIDRDRVRLDGIEPGQAMQRFVERIPLKRTGTPQDMASAAAFLCSSESDYITGQTLNVDGGFEMD